jgi:uncharacterized protein
MIGVSYFGTVQWLAAREHPPQLVCIAPTAAAGRFMDETPYQGGAFELEFSIRILNLLSVRSWQGPNADGLDLKEILNAKAAHGDGADYHAGCGNNSSH